MTERLASLRLEAQTSRTLLPRCRRCGAPHPLAVADVLDPDTCHRCGGPATPPGPPQVSASVVPRAAWPWRARVCLAIGDFLRRLERMLR